VHSRETTYSTESLTQCREAVQSFRGRSVFARGSWDSEAGDGEGARRPEDRVSKATVDQQRERDVGPSRLTHICIG